MPTVEIWADSRGQGRCRGCGATIEWAEIVASAKKMPFNDVLVLQTRHEPATMRLIEIVDLDRNHWASCAEREQFKHNRR